MLVELAAHAGVGHGDGRDRVRVQVTAADGDGDEDVARIVAGEPGDLVLEQRRVLGLAVAVDVDDRVLLGRVDVLEPGELGGQVVAELLVEVGAGAAAVGDRVAEDDVRAELGVGRQHGAAVMVATTGAGAAAPTAAAGAGATAGVATGVGAAAAAHQGQHSEHSKDRSRRVHNPRCTRFANTVQAKS